METKNSINAPKVRMDVNETIEHVGAGPFQLMMLLICGVTFMVEACETMLLSFLLPTLGKEWKLTPFEESLIGSMVFFGVMIGSFLWGFVGDKFGRRVALICFVLNNAICGVSIGFSLNYVMLLIICVFTGVGIGGINTPLNLLVEFVPTKQRGLYGVLIECFWSFGSMYEAFLAWAFLSGEFLNLSSLGPFFGEQWRWFLLVSSFPILSVLIFIPLIPESLRYLSLKGKKKQIKKILRRMEILNCRKLPENLDIIVKNKQERVGNVRELFNGKKIIIILLNCCLMSIGNSIAYYGVSLSTPHFFESSGNVYIGSFLASCSEFFGIMYSACFVKFVGRKKIVGFQALNTGLGLLLISIPTDHVGLKIVLSIFVRMNVMGSSSMNLILIQESLPTNVRSTGMGIASFCGKGADIVAPFISEMLSIDGLPIPEIVYACIALINTVLIFSHPVETRNRNLTDLMEDDDEKDESQEDDNEYDVETDTSDEKKPIFDDNEPEIHSI